MTLIQLQYFLAVCKYENFTRAAENFNISQPAISGAIRELERECGVALFNRDKNALRITDEGRVLRDEAELVLRQYGQLDDIVKNLSTSRKFIRVSFPTLSGNQVYPKLLRVFKDKYPDIEVFSVEASTSKQFEYLDKGMVDLVLSVRRFDAPEDQRQFDQVHGHYPLKISRQCVCVHKDHPLAKQSYVTMEQLSGEELVMLSEGFSQSAGIKRQFKQRGLSYKVIHYTSQMYTLERFVEKGVAVGFLPEEVIKRNPLMVAIPYEGSRYSPIEIFWRKDRYMYRSVKAFLDTARELYPKPQEV